MDETIKPHTAIISIQLEVHSLLATGECSGKVVSREILKEHGIKDAFLTIVSGSTMENCLKKLKAKLEEMENDNVESV